jgi:hypothetical protein
MNTGLVTPDRRYLVVIGRLWRAANPSLPAADCVRFTRALMAARRAVRAAKDAGDELALRRARIEVNAAKQALGERGPVWWSDGAPDYNRTLVRNTPYAGWYAEVMARRADADAATRPDSPPPGFIASHFGGLSALGGRAA